MSLDVGCGGSVSVVVADDHPAMVAGIRAILGSDPGIRVVAEAADGRQAVQLVVRYQPDVALLDISMPYMSGVEAARAIGERSPSTAVVILTQHAGEAYVARALDAGVSAYLLKEVMEPELIGAVRRAARGETSLISAVGLSRTSRSLGQSSCRLSAGLSDREVECLRMAASGLTTKQIARKLFVGEQTVKTYFDRAFLKLGVRDRTAAVFEAVKRGYMDYESEG